jgi:UDP-glucose 4-epimerase
MNVLVTGGAGYIGSVIVEELLNNGNSVIIVDNLKQGHREAVLKEAKLIEADICDPQALENVFLNNEIQAIVHLAAESLVERSMHDPRVFFQTNVTGAINILNNAVKYNVRKIVNSSSAAVYGEPPKIPIYEESPVNPINSYGESKIIFERILDWYSRAYGIKYVSFRYFNAAGATRLCGEDHDPETHLIPNVIRAALLQKSEIKVFGLDYPTNDGSCVRDYLHVLDIAKAHITALNNLENIKSQAYNLGTGKGYSVLEIIRAVEKISAKKVPFIQYARRKGDPAILVANSEKAEKEIAWKPRFSALNNIIESALSWFEKHPYGYNSK